MQINSIQQNQNANPTFRVRYTKRTVTRLKELIPRIVDVTKNEQEYKLVKSAFENLVQAGKSKDGLVVDFYDGYMKGFRELDIRTKQANGKVKDFLYPDLPKKYDTFGRVSDVTSFYDKCRFINSPELKQESEKTIEGWANHRASQSKWQNFKDDLGYIWEDVKEKVEDIVDATFSLIEDGITGKVTWEPIEIFKDWRASKKHYSEISKKHADKISELRAFADKLPTK